MFDKEFIIQKAASEYNLTGEDMYNIRGHSAVSRICGCCVWYKVENSLQHRSYQHITEWLRQNTKDENIIILAYMDEVWFKNEEDAVAFKIMFSEG